MKVINNIAYCEENHERQKLDIYVPDADTFPVFVFFHGGGIVNGSKDGFVQFGKALANQGICTVCANYRLYPSASYPEFILDAAAAVAWVKKNIPQYGNCTGLYVGGSSAGAYLSMMLAFDNKYLEAHKMSPMDISGFIHDAGQPTAHFNVLKERGIDSRRVIIDESAPLFHIGTHEVLPPMLFLVATDDMRNRLEQTHLVMSTLRHFGFEGDDWEERVIEGTHVNYANTNQAEIIANYIQERQKGL